jgi:hypothetical protein
MQIIIHQCKNSTNIAEIISDGIVINNVQDALDIMAIRIIRAPEELLYMRKIFLQIFLI